MEENGVPNTKTLSREIMWESFQQFIPKAAIAYNCNKALEAASICRKYRSIAKRVLPEHVSTNTDAKSYQERILTLKANTTAHAQELNFKAHLIQQELNQAFGEDTVLKIKIEITE